MSGQVSYVGSPVRVRGDLVVAHRRFWDRLARPGTWWTSAERIAIASESRRARSCALCAARKASLSPNLPVGEHDCEAGLPVAAIDAVHRLVNDASRLGSAWLARFTETGLTHGHYVELVGTVAAMASIDGFCRGIGVDLHPLPTPGPGEPSRYTPPTAVAGEAWVPMIPADGNTGAEQDLWERGRTGNVIRAMSLVPDEVRTLADLSGAHYLANARVRDPGARMAHLDRSQMELIAGRVSALNQCYY